MLRNKQLKASLICLLVFSMTGSAFASGYSITDIPPIHAEAAEVQETTYDAEDCFAGYAEQVLYGIPERAFYGRSAGSRLTGAAGNLYQVLKPKLQAIPDASGNQVATTFVLTEAEFSSLGAAAEITSRDLGLTSIYSPSGGISQETVNAAFRRFLSINGFSLTTDALMLDLPYDMFWYGHQVQYDATFGVHGESLFVTSLEVSFLVAANYRGSNEYSVNLSPMQAVEAAASAARAIVEKYADCTDYEKLAGYRDEICALTEYDFGAASGGNAAYDGDPWQLIHVFDSDPSTNVVCEGYAKAFQYLCDLSGFAEGNDVVCYTVTGYMGSPEKDLETHMWNIVRMEDGNHYLADITNSDSSAIGAGGELFLAGAEGSIEEGYTCPIEDTFVDYHYLPSQIALWGDDDSSVLKLASGSYVPEIPVVPVLPGDANGDGKITATDLTLLARHVAKIRFLSDSAALANADIDGDGSPDIDDVIRLARYLAKITSLL